MSSVSALDSNSRFRKYVQYSIGAHIAVFLFFGVKTAFFTDEPINFEQAVRVDMVALPDKVMTELPPAPVTAAPEKKAETQPTTPPVAKEKVEPKKEPLPKKTLDKEAINLDKAKTKQKEALAKLKQMQALEEIESELENEKKKKAQEAVKSYKGNVLSAGTALTGVNKMQADNYLGDIHEHVKANWSLPEYLRKRSLQTTVLIRIDESGAILSKSITRSSGNPVFDDLVLSAIEKSSPLPRPPEKFVKIASIQGFSIGFSE